jgi:hypothetical protein
LDNFIRTTVHVKIRSISWKSIFKILFIEQRIKTEFPLNKLFFVAG